MGKTVRKSNVKKANNRGGFLLGFSESSASKSPEYAERRHDKQRKKTIQKKLDQELLEESLAEMLGENYLDHLQA